MICRILLLTILTSCVSGSFVVNVTQTCYQAEENHNITLEWTFTTKPDRSSKSLFIHCSLSHKLHEILPDLVIPEILTPNKTLYHVDRGVEVTDSRDKDFTGRLSSDKDALGEGRIRLQLSRLRTEDSGHYLCEVNTDHGSGYKSCHLNVTAADQRLLTPRPERRRSITFSAGVLLLIGIPAASAVALIVCVFWVIFCKSG
ncbi:uncharacterized protein LOC120725868 [Simochromis diagramma]|uniref:uncharacterized protein LOC120725868 n=1 Tax=Simochromis diagramma TaxID=43689 RepID=UPI001A7E46AB|nr:uncharacterized protein LOC120725868 [Simochromis diagramma]